MYNFDMKNKEYLDKIRSPIIYEFNMGVNLALLSDDPSVIREFLRIEIPKLYKNNWLAEQGSDLFMQYYQKGQAFAYFGIVPMIVNAMVNLIASNGFDYTSENEEIEEKLNEIKEDAQFEKAFCDGVYWCSGIGDVLFRISYDKSISDTPILDVIEPQFFEINYSHGQIKSYIIKKPSSKEPSIELLEIYSKDKDGFVEINYYFKKDGELVPKSDEAKIAYCQSKFMCDIPNDIKLGIKEYPLLFVKNFNNNQLYKGERGVPTIQGFLRIEDALTELFSDLIDAVRKGGIKTYVSDELIPQTAEGKTLWIDQFNKTIIQTKGSSTPGEGNLWNTVQSNIQYESYVEPIKTIMSIAINKAGLSPTTIGLTGIESINSSAESQEAREKTSMRTREKALIVWNKALKDLMNKYLKFNDYINGREEIDYSDLFSVSINKYANPSTENLVDLLMKERQAGLISQVDAIKALNDGMSDDNARAKYVEIMTEYQQMQQDAVEDVQQENSTL